MPTIYGTDNADTIQGTNNADLIYGGIGNDIIYGYDGGDTLYGGWDDDTLYGGLQPDILYGEDGNDSLYGEADNDMLHGGFGDDLLDGGDGYDWAVYWNSTSGVMVDLRAGTATGEGEDELVSIEAVIGSDQEDILIGNAGPNNLEGGWGNDTIYATTGIDVLEGGDGFDTLDFTLIDEGVFVQLDLSRATFGTSFNAIGGFERIITTEYADIVSGISQDLVLMTGGGDDFVQIYAGSNSIYLEGGNDLVFAGMGNDYLFGGDGFDVVYFYMGVEPDFGENSIVGVRVDLTRQIQDNLNQSDVLVSIEGVGGTIYADTLLGDANPNMLNGFYEGGSTWNDDLIRGEGGDDWVIVGEGNHDLAGGTGNDMLEFTGSQQDSRLGTGIVFSLANQGDVQDTGVGFMTAVEFENVTGWQMNDRLSGDAAHNIIAGGQGSDTLLGGAGNDTLHGDSKTLMDETGWYLSLDGIDETALNDDTIYGGDGDDVLYGEYGNDLLNGGEGLDQLFGGVGDDTLRGNAQKDRLEGNEGRDKMYGGSGKDTLRGDIGNDVLKGNGGDDLLDGGIGNDKIQGHGGADRIIGGQGDDNLSGGGSADIFVFGADSGNDVIVDFTDGDTIEFAVGLGLAFDDLLIADTETGALISWGGTDSILLEGVAAASIDAGDFDFGASAAAATLAQIDAGLAA